MSRLVTRWHGAARLTVCALALAPTPATAGVERAQATPTAVVRARAPTVETQDRALAGALLQLAMHPSPAAQHAVAAEYCRLGLLEQAYAHLTAVIRLNPREPAAYEMRARIWRDWGFPGRGMGDAARAAYYAPDSASAHNTWGTLLAATGRLTEARHEFERARALSPGASYALTNLCYVAFVTGAIQNAIADCRLALEIDPESVVVRNNLALSLTAAGEYGAAEDQFRAAGGAMTGQYNAGVAYLAAGRFSEARAAFESVAAAHPLGGRARARAEQARAAARNVAMAARDGGSER